MGSSLWICLDVSWQTIAMNTLSQQYGHLQTTSTLRRSLVLYIAQQKLRMSVDEDENIEKQKWAKENI